MWALLAVCGGEGPWDVQVGEVGQQGKVDIELALSDGSEFLQ